MESSNRSDIRLNEDQKLLIYQRIAQLRKQLPKDGLQSHEENLELWNKSVQNCQQQGLMKAIYASKLAQIGAAVQTLPESKSKRMFAKIDQLTRALFEPLDTK